MNFEELNLAPAIVKAVREQGYETPTAIQAQAIPLILDGRDLLGGAQTGTGKTAAFTLPMLHRLTMSRSAQNKFGGTGIRALVLTPTRELAAQVEESVRTYGKYLQLSSTVVFGGVGMNPQISKLKKGDYETAFTIFKSPYEEESEQWGARWGQYQVLGTPQYPGHDYLQACLKLDSLSAQLKTLRKRDLKQELADAYDLSVASITAFKKTIADSCWAEISEKHNLRSVDSFINIVAKPKRTIAVAAAKQRDQLRREAANNWTRYRDMQYLYADTSHYQWLRDSMSAQLARIENALLPAFWDRGSKTAEIGKFFDAVPNHPVSRHFTAPAFRAAVESGRLKNLLAFEIAYPRSPFSA
ncbi:MAG TPA: DEAD/DEAH box helicase, partial [Rhodoferax sp.]|nr:DEAD/DEAH box helicase [Rhodoferax sp.]